MAMQAVQQCCKRRRNSSPTSGYSNPVDQQQLPGRLQREQTEQTSTRAGSNPEKNLKRRRNSSPTSGYSNPVDQQQLPGRLQTEQTSTRAGSNPERNLGFDSQDDSMFVRVFSSCSFQELSKLVSEHMGRRIVLKSPRGSESLLRITPELEGYGFSGRETMLETWEEMFLPEPEKMVVMGIIDSIFPEDGTVLVDSQLRVYLYDPGWWILHLVAESIKDFLRDGPKFPPIRTFEYREFLGPLSDEDCLRIMEEEDMTLLSQATKDFVQSSGKKILANLDFLRSK